MSEEDIMFILQKYDGAWAIIGVCDKEDVEDVSLTLFWLLH